MALAEDALQETFIKVWRSMDRFEGRGGASVRTWIIRNAINTCKNTRTSAWFRRVDRGKVFEELPPSVTGVTDEKGTLFFKFHACLTRNGYIIVRHYSSSVFR